MGIAGLGLGMLENQTEKKIEHDTETGSQLVLGHRISKDQRPLQKGI